MVGLEDIEQLNFGAETFDYSVTTVRYNWEKGLPKLPFTLFFFYSVRMSHSWDIKE